MSFFKFNWYYAKHPKAKSLQESEFLQEYRALPIGLLSEDAIKNCLTKDAKIFFEKCPKHWSIGEKSVNIWTSECMYKAINNALISDDKKKLKKYMPLIRGINLYLNQPMEKDTKSYRGSSVTEKQLSAFKVGQIYRCPMYIASSLKEEVAKGFNKEKSNNTLFYYDIPKDTMNGRDVSRFSCFPQEGEVLFPPYTAFEVIKIDINKDDDQSFDKNKIYVKILDNKVVEKLEDEGKICHTWEETHDGYDLNKKPKYDKKQGAQVVFKNPNAEAKEEFEEKKYADIDQIHPKCFECASNLELIKIEIDDNYRCNKCRYYCNDWRFNCEEDDFDLCYECAVSSL